MEQINQIVQSQVQSLKPESTPEERIRQQQFNTAKQNREKLKQLSNSLAVYQEEARQKGITIPTINQLLMDYYKQQWKVDSMVFRTYDDWKKDGYQVIRGEKALLLWGNKVVKIINQELDSNGKPIPNSGKKIEYCEILHVFNEYQTFNPEDCR